MMVKTCVKRSNLLFLRTAQAIPSGMVMASARIVAKMLMKIVYFIGAATTLTTSFLY